MARSHYDTLLSIDEWAEQMHIDPFTLNQIGAGFPDGTSIGINAGCRDVFYQFGWQKDALSREEIGLAIQKAEDMLAKALNFYPAPRYIVQEQIQYPSRRRGGYAYGLGAWSTLNPSFPYAYPYRASVQTRWQKVWGGGTRARTYIIDTADLTLSASAGDGVLDTFTATATVPAGTAASEIYAYIRATDRIPANVAVGELWRIRPITVSVSGTTATITGHSSLLVKPVHETIVNPQPLDVTDTATYVEQLSIYRVYRDTEQSGNAYWEPYDNCNETPCTLETTTLCIGDRNARMGQVFIGYGNDECCTGWRAPDKVTLNYLAGEALGDDGRMQPEYAQYVAHLATGLLANFSCGCDRAQKVVNWWRFDVSSLDQEQGGRPLTPEEQQSPFGYTRGALYVWGRIFDTQQITGVSV